RIFTGGLLPAGADAIVMQETCAVSGDHVSITAEGKRHWRRRGEDVSAGALAFPAGLRLRLQDMPLLAALGRTEVAVFRRLHVGLFSTGDELREPGEPLVAGQIWDANRYLLRGLLAAMGCEVHDLGILHDDPKVVEGALLVAARGVDLIV